MSDELLRRLGEVERRRRPGEEWDEVLEGTATSQEATERGRARGEQPEDLDALAQASAPLTGAERKAWATRAKAALQTTDDEDDEDPAEVEAPAGVVDLDSRRTRLRWGGGVLALLVAAALVLWIRARPQPGVPTEAGAPLPAFSMTVRNDTVAEIRGAEGSHDDGPARYRPDSRIHWSFQPEAPVDGPLELAAIVRGEGVSCLARPSLTRASDNGVLELRGAVGETLGLGSGRWTLEVIIARAGSLPDDASGCQQPRDLPCPCPLPLRPGASIEASDLQPPRGSAAWRTATTYEMLVEASAQSPK
ncbi:MAG: hypothetical protein AAF799_32245 [Myxococcota bacterium]